MTKRFILLFGLIICAGAASAKPLVDGSVDAGQKRSAACAACHGPKGNKESDQFPKLAGQNAPYIYEQLKLFKSGKRKNAVMNGQAAGLSDEDMKNLAAYFAAQQTQPGVADPAIAPAGAAVYRGGLADKQSPACSGCHGPSGLGNAAAKYPRLAGQNPQYVVKQLTAYRDGSRGGYRKATIMNGVAQNLSDTDIKALASYVSGLQTAKPGQSSGQGALMQNASGPKSGTGTHDGGQKQQKQGQTPSHKSGAKTDNGGQKQGQNPSQTQRSGQSGAAGKPSGDASGSGQSGASGGSDQAQRVSPSGTSGQNRGGARGGASGSEAAANDNSQ